jgi:L-alanine-DL-glutamate epimerase-like enolase superfamily enzyme
MSPSHTRGGTPVEAVRASAYKVPTDAPEADGTFAWNATTIVLVEAAAGGETGLGYTYADAATAKLVTEALAEVVRGRDAMDVGASFVAMGVRIRNLGRAGVAAMAVSAVDMALWDLKARLLGVSLAALLGPARDRVDVYGSGGFTSYSDDQIQRQLGGWAERGIPRVKMKVGTHPADDPRRVRVAREAVGPRTELFVDANGAYSRKQALALAETFAGLGVSWFEEPVSSDDLEGLRLLRDRGPAGMDVAAGEYGYDLYYFRRMLEAGAVDVLQADATRCFGVSGFLRVSALCEANGLPLSAHCGPSVHAHLGCACPPLRHIEYFHDHDRIEHMLFDGALTPEQGALRPDPGRPGLGLELKRKDAEKYAV